MTDFAIDFIQEIDPAGYEIKKGRIIRLGHLGYYHEPDMFTMISALEGTLLDLGLSDKPGRGTEALLNSFAEE